MGNHPHYYSTTTSGSDCNCYEDVASFGVFNVIGECMCPLTHVFNPNSKSCDQVVITVPPNTGCLYFDVVNNICIDSIPTEPPATTATTAIVYPTIDPTLCEEIPVYWKGTKWSKIVFRSQNSVMVRINVANNDVVNVDPYLGFLVFTKRECGIDFVKAWWNNKIKYKILSTFVRVDKSQTQAAVQFR